VVHNEGKTESTPQTLGENMSTENKIVIAVVALIIAGMFIASYADRWQFGGHAQVEVK